LKKQGVKQMERVTILETYVDNLSMNETVDAVEEYIKDRRFLHLMGVNADKINAMHDDPELKRIVNECAIINADGVSVVWASKKLKTPLKERVAGIDLMERLLKRAEEKGYCVYLLGAKQEVVEKCARVIKKEYPTLDFRGFRNGYFKKEQWEEVAAEIEAAAPQIVFVGITSPLKEYLIEYFRERGMKIVFMGVGGSFDVISGMIPRAPMWMQRMGLEWLFRVIQEPGRLWKRYLIGNTRFIWSVYQEKYRKCG